MSAVIKLLIIGASVAGKTCLLSRYVDDEFTSEFISTIGLDFRFKTVQVRDTSKSPELIQKAEIERRKGEVEGVLSSLPYTSVRGKSP